MNASKEECMTDLKIKIARLEERLVGADKALDLAKETIQNSVDVMDKRLEGMNEFRSTLKDQTATFITRVEFDKSIAFQNRVIGAIMLLVFLVPLFLNLVFRKG